MPYWFGKSAGAQENSKVSDENADSVTHKNNDQTKENDEKTENSSERTQSNIPDAVPDKQGWKEPLNFQTSSNENPDSSRNAEEHKGSPTPLKHDDPQKSPDNTPPSKPARATASDRGPSPPLDSDPKTASNHRQNTPYWKFQSGGDSQKQGTKPVRLTKVAPPMVPGASTKLRPAESSDFPASDDSEGRNFVDVPPPGTTGRVFKIVHQINRRTSEEEQTPFRRPSLQNSIGEKHAGNDDTVSISSSVISELLDTSSSKLSDHDFNALEHAGTGTIDSTGGSMRKGANVSDPSSGHNKSPDSRANGRVSPSANDIHDAHIGADGVQDNSPTHTGSTSSDESSPGHLSEDDMGANRDSPPRHSRKKSRAPPPPKSSPPSLNRKIQGVPNGQAGFSEC